MEEEGNGERRGEDWVSAPVLRIGLPQCKHYHWLFIGVQISSRSNWTHSPVAMKRNPITLGIIREDCLWSRLLPSSVYFCVELCMGVCVFLELNCQELDTLYFIEIDEVCFVCTVYFTATVWSSY